MRLGGLCFSVGVTTPIVGRGHLHKTTCQEQISLAYGRAVASAAGCAFEGREIDHYGVDATFHHATLDVGFDPKQIEAQFKCTTQDVLGKDDLTFSGLKQQHYQRLTSTKVQVPRILVVMVVPKDMDAWLVQSQASLLVAGCAYWVSLRGGPDVTTRTTTVKVPRANVFGPQPLLNMMQRVAGGGLP